VVSWNKGDRSKILSVKFSSDDRGFCCDLKNKTIADESAPTGGDVASKSSVDRVLLWERLQS
jgi:hypothetical protein